MKKLSALLVLCCFVLLSGCWVTTRNGEHSGQVTAVEQNGLVWPTWDLYLKSDVSSSQEDFYCVEDEDLIPLLKQAAKDSKRVTLKYHSEFFIAPWRCSGDTVVDTFTFLED